MQNGGLSGLAVCGLIVVLVGCSAGASKPVSQPPPVLDSIKVSQSETRFFTTSAKGVQIYECQAKKSGSILYEWVLMAPEADLFDGRGKKAGHHYAGPTWEASDGSKVVGEVKGRESSTDGNAIPWLLLKAKKHEGNGTFSRVSSVQRVETAGGKASAGGCDQLRVGKELRVPYTAVYHFYVPSRP